jgi:lipopolysaccharide export LptBFGC system permease protein LptF
MHRHRELVALLAAGVGLARVAMPFVVGMFVLSVGQLLNQELILPRVAPLLLRGHTEIGEETVAEFPVHFTRDAHGALYHAHAFDPRDSTLHDLTILERDELGRTVRRIAAKTARWTEEGPEGSGWRLDEAVALTLAPVEGDEPAQRREAITFYASDLSPHAITMRRYGEFASMLSLRQISEMLATPGVADARMLRRYRYSRFAAVLINVVVMWMALPTFLLRQPANLLVQAMLCSAVAIPALIGGAIAMVVDMPGIPPAVSVFLPVLVLVPVVLGRWTYLKT